MATSLTLRVSSCSPCVVVVAVAVVVGGLLVTVQYRQVEQVANLLCALVNSASYSQQDGK